MNIENTAHIFLALSLASSLGCGERAERETKVIEKIAAPDATMASTAAPSVVEPVEIEAPPAPVEKLEAREEAEPLPEPKTIEPKTIESKAFEPTVYDADGLTLRRFVTTSTIEDREPTGAGSVFLASNERVYAFVEASNESQSPKTLLVHFFGPDGKVSGGVELEIPASVPRWRTWAYTRHAKKPGAWRVEIRDANGTLFGALPFEIAHSE